MKKIFRLAIILLMIICFLVGCTTTAELEFEASVIDIKVTSGGFGSPSLATVYFDNGKVIPFYITRAADFTIGHSYFIKCHRRESVTSMCWVIDVLERR